MSVLGLVLAVGLCLLDGFFFLAAVTFTFAVAIAIAAVCPAAAPLALFEEIIYRSCRTCHSGQDAQYHSNGFECLLHNIFLLDS